jgi:uncharacterized protein (DUF433 family)
MAFVKTQTVPLQTTEQGTLLVEGTRIPLDTIVYAFRRGDTAEEIVEQYDGLRLADVYTLISYYLNNQEEIDNYIQRREAEAAQLRQRLEQQLPQKGLREKLLARQREIYVEAGG